MNVIPGFKPTLTTLYHSRRWNDSSDRTNDHPGYRAVSFTPRSYVRCPQPAQGRDLLSSQGNFIFKTNVSITFVIVLHLLFCIGCRVVEQSDHHSNVKGSSLAAAGA